MALGRTRPQARGRAARAFRMRNKPHRRERWVVRSGYHSRTPLFARRNSAARRSERRARRASSKPWHRRRRSNGTFA